MQPQKPGYLTTEFWVTVVTQIVTVLVLTGAVKAADAADLKDATSKAVVSAAALIASAATVWRYIASRTSVKTPPTN